MTEEFKKLKDDLQDKAKLEGNKAIVMVFPDLIALEIMTLGRKLYGDSFGLTDICIISLFSKLSSPEALNMMGDEFPSLRKFLIKDYKNYNRTKQLVLQESQ